MCPNQSNKKGKITRRLRILSLFTLGKRRLRDALVAIYNSLMKGEERERRGREELISCFQCPVIRREETA